MASSANQVNLDRQRKQRRNLSLEDKIDIIKRKEANAKLSDEKLANEFGVDRSTISNILRKKEQFLQLHANANYSDLRKTRIQEARFPSLEEALYKWFQSLCSQNIPVSQDVLRVKAVEFYNKAKESGTQLSNFEASKGWLEKFQKRYNSSSKIITGESGSVILEHVESGRKRLQELIALFDIENVYNADETGLFFRLGPNKTLATKNDKAKGTKKNKERITVLLCCNATGSKKFKPLVIGKYQNPRCFKKINMQTLPVQYTSNSKAWMTMEKWNEWLRWLDNQLVERSLLLIDNCPAHTDGSSIGLKHLQVEFLPPNTTSHIQPCDAGIIQNFKVNYRAILVSKWVKNIDNGEVIRNVNIKEAVEMVADAWGNVRSTTIKNCWQLTKILPETYSTADEMEIDEIDEDMANLISALNRLQIADSSVSMTAEEYAQLDGGLISSELPTEEEILEEFLAAEGISQQEQVHIEDSSEEEEETISINIGREALETAKKFLEQRGFMTEEDIKYIRNIIRRLDESVQKSKRQTLLTEYINQ